MDKSKYYFREIEKKWQEFWEENQTFKAIDNDVKPKYYILDMFPYPSGAGLHVGHPLGYIASDVYARYKRLKGFNVLHPIGFDAFGLPTEQYAIQTGIHPSEATDTNTKRYRKQLDQIGFSFDWTREVTTSDPSYYKWTQWIFIQLFNSWYNKNTDKAESIAELIKTFEKEGNTTILAASDQITSFTADQWKEFTADKKQKILLNYRLAFISTTHVNWCPELGTVLANDEVKNGLSERGGYPVIQKNMKQWSLRITAYAERLLNDLDSLHWEESIKEIQRNWIGKSKGASVHFNITDHPETIEVFTTRPDTIFGVSFIVLAPEHPLLKKITTKEQKNEIETYIAQTALRSERDRMSDTKNISGAFTGAHAIHPFTNKKIPIWTGDYVLASYGTGAVMSVPSGDQRDWDFANHFNIDKINIVKDGDISNGAIPDKNITLTNSDFLNDIKASKAIKIAIEEIEKNNFGKGKTNYKLRDAVFSRQRYWGEPFPITFDKDNSPITFNDQELPLILPDVDKYLPTESGEPPLARAKNWTKNDQNIDVNVMPGWAGSSWYFLRYLDPNNDKTFADRDKIDYWKNVDLYIGGAEHATGHLLYARFWTKFLYDLNLIPFSEPFQKMINQGMIQGNSAFVYRDNATGRFVSKNKIGEKEVTPIHVDINFLEGDILDVEKFKSWRKEFNNCELELEDNGDYIVGREVEKMSKSKFNVQTPDELVEKYGADTLRCYEMFLGPIEQHKPWDTQGIEGVHKFLRKLWKLYFNETGLQLTSDEPTKENLKTLHKTIKKVSEDIERFSLNTVVSTLMIAVNEFTQQKCTSKAILEPFIVLVSSYAPHLAEEIWETMGNSSSISEAVFPSWDKKHLVEDNHKYPISFNGKMRFILELPTNLNKEAIEHHVMKNENTIKWLDNKTPKKIIVVPKKIVNIVI